eukprot:1215644-Prymnesium_polylepis.1
MRFWCRSNSFEKRATLWRRDTARQNFARGAPDGPRARAQDRFCGVLSRVAALAGVLSMGVAWTVYARGRPVRGVPERRRHLLPGYGHTLTLTAALNKAATGDVTCDPQSSDPRSLGALGDGRRDPNAALEWRLALGGSVFFECPRHGSWTGSGRGFGHALSL